MIWFLIIAFVDTFLDWTWVSKKKWNDWQRKYAKPLQPYTSWYYFGLYKPKYKERKPYSTTLFVWLTDWYHFAKFCRLIALILLTGLPIYYIIIYAVFSHYTYMYLKSKN